MQIDDSHQVSPMQAWIVKAVANRRSAEWMAKELNQYFEERDVNQQFSARTVRRACKGLAGQRDKLPAKWKLKDDSKRFLKPIEKHPDNLINFRTTRDGDQLIASIQLPENLSMLNRGTGFEDFGFEELEEDKVRPHKCFWREEIDRKPSEDARFSWSDRRTVLAEKGVSWTEVVKENPRKEQSVTAELVHYKDVRVILFENTVQIRFDMPMIQKPIFEVLDEWWSKRSEVVDWLEGLFESVSVKSSPLDVQMPLSASEWGLVEDEFAVWVDENPTFQDDAQNCLFEVTNDDGEQIFVVDNSPDDGFGGDVPESEFNHQQFGAEHISNMKQAVKWLSYLEVRPEHFEASKWVFHNRSELEGLVGVPERVDGLESDLDFTRCQVEGLTLGVSRLRSRLDSVESEVEDLGLSVKVHESQISGLSEQMQNNRDEFYQELNSQASRIDEVENVSKDVVERVDYTRQEVNENKERISEAKQEITQRVQSDYESVQKDLEVVGEQVNGVVRQNQRLKNNQEDIMQELQMQREANAEKLDQLIEEQRKTFVDRVKENMSSMKGVVSSIATAIF